MRSVCIYGAFEFVYTVHIHVVSILKKSSSHILSRTEAYENMGRMDEDEILYSMIEEDDAAPSNGISAVSPSRSLKDRDRRERERDGESRSRRDEKAKEKRSRFA
jgi:hypothetical protein